jgi:hypothetical protein
MQKWLSKILFVAGLVAMAALSASPARAQAGDKEKPVVYTYVAQWAVPRADWPAYEKGNAAIKQIMDKLVADGTISGYGWFKTLIHQEGAPTHGEWWSAASMANVMKALAVVSAPNGANSDALGKILAESKHWDYLISSREYGFHPGTYENTYLRVGTYKVKAGEGENARKAISSYIVPILEKLLADGAIHFYSIDREVIHTGDPGEVDAVIITNGAEGLDKFYAALEAGGKATPTGPMAFGSTNDSSAHRDILALTTAVFK